MNGVTPEQMAKGTEMSMDLIHEFRSMMVAEIGSDEPYFLKGINYSIADDNRDPEIIVPTEEDSRALEQDIEDYDEYVHNF
jgi:hypothetical protein